MNKMAVPNLEIIRFTTEDVIVTSGTGQVSSPITYSYCPGFNNNTSYVATADELKQGGYSYTESAWYRFVYSSNSDQKFQSITPWDPNSDTDYFYAWFRESVNTWWTDPRKSKKYNSLPPTN